MKTGLGEASPKTAFPPTFNSSGAYIPAAESKPLIRKKVEQQPAAGSGEGTSEREEALSAPDEAPKKPAAIDVGAQRRQKLKTRIENVTTLSVQDLYNLKQDLTKLAKERLGVLELIKAQLTQKTDELDTKETELDKMQETLLEIEQKLKEKQELLLAIEQEAQTAITENENKVKKTIESQNRYLQTLKMNQEVIETEFASKQRDQVKLTQNIQEQKREFDDIAALIVEQKQQAQEIRDTYEKLRERENSEKMQIEELGQQIQQSKIAKAQVENDIDTLKKDKTDVQASIKELKTQLEEIHTQHETAITQLKEEQSTFAIQKQYLRSALKKIRDQTAASRTENTQLDQDRAKLLSDLEHLKEKQAQSQSEFEDLFQKTQQEIEIITKNLAEKQGILSQLEKDIEQKQSQYESILEKTQTATVTLAELQTTIVTKQKEMGSLDAQVLAKEKELIDVQTRHQRVIHEFETKISSLQIEETRLAEQIQDIKKQADTDLEEKASQLIRLEKQLNQIRETIGEISSNFEKDKTVLDVDLLKKQDDLQKITHALSEKQHHFDDLESTYKEIQKIIEAKEESLQDKITASTTKLKNIEIQHTKIKQKHAAEIQDFKTQRTALQETVERLKLQEIALGVELKNLTDRLQNEQALIQQRLNDQKESFATKTKELEERVQEKRARIKTQNAQILLAQAQLKNVNKKIKDAKDKYQQELAKHQLELLNVRENVRVQEETKTRNADELLQLQRNIATQQANLDAKQQEIVSLEDSHSKQTKSYAQEIQNLQDQVAKLQDVERRLPGAQGKIDRLQQDIRDLKQRQDELQKKYAQQKAYFETDLETMRTDLENKRTNMQDLDEKIKRDQDRLSKLASAIGYAAAAMAKIGELSAANAGLQEQLEHCHAAKTKAEKEPTQNKWVWNGGPCPLVVKCLSLLKISALHFLRPYEKVWQPEFLLKPDATASSLYLKIQQKFPGHKIAVQQNEDASFTFKEMPLQTLLTKQQKTLHKSLGVSTFETRSLKDVEVNEENIVAAFVDITTNWYYYEKGIKNKPDSIRKDVIDANKNVYKQFLRGQYPYVDIMIDYFLHDHAPVYANSITIVYRSGVNVACKPFTLKNVGVLMPPSRPGESMGLYFALMFSNSNDCFLTGTYDYNTQTLTFGQETAYEDESETDRDESNVQSYVTYILYSNFWSNFAKHYPISNRGLESRYARALDASRSSLNIDHAQDVLNGLSCA